MPIKTLAVMVSGTGSNLQMLIDRTKSGDIPATITGVVADRPCRGLERAWDAGIPAKLVERKAFDQFSEFQAAMLVALKDTQAQAVITAGYLSILSKSITEAYPLRMINVHPSLLPAFGGTGCFGSRVHQMVLENGCKITGATVHFVEQEVDCGPIIAQGSIPVYWDDTPDTIAQRLHSLEHVLLGDAVKAFCEGRIHVTGRRVRIQER